MYETPYLEVRDVSKSFPGVKALDSVSFKVRPSTVHALCGENGAGKSTLMKVINGLYTADSGEILIHGKPVKINNPKHALDLGVAMISQELNYVPDMTVAESLYMGALPGSAFKINWRNVQRSARQLLQDEDISISPHTKLGALTVSQIQTLEIAKAINKGAQVIIMDEPTSAIAHREVDHLFSRIRTLREAGTSIVYISHKMDEVFELADDISVLRDGRVVDTRPASEFSRNEVITLMVGRKFDETAFPTRTGNMGEESLSVKNLTREGNFRDVSLNVRSGEIVGIAGLVGAGRTELLETIFGLRRANSGEVRIHGKTANITNPRKAIANGLAMLTEDRRLTGIIPEMPIRANASLASLKNYIAFGRYHKKKEIADTSESFQRMRVKAPGIETKISSLSGGNQQKILLSRWILSRPEILLLDEPTRGIDVGAKLEIYTLVSEIVSEGKSAIVVSSELPELMGLCDRIYVMSAGRIAGHLTREEFDARRIIELAMSELEEAK